MMKHTKTLRPPSCKAWRDAGHTTDGLYTIYPGIESGDETNGYEVYCDQTTDSGGWMLTWAYAHTGGYSDPLVGGTIPTDPNNGYSHFDLNDFAGFTYDSIEDTRLYCTSPQLHTRKIHFKASAGLHKTMAWDGSSLSNSVYYWNGYYGGITYLVGHTGNLPGSTVHASGRSTDAYSYYPFYYSGAYHWNIRAHGYYWECDEYTASSSYTTLHQVWVRTASSSRGSWDNLFSVQLHAPMTPLGYANADEFEAAVNTALQAAVSDGSLTAALPASSAAAVIVSQIRDYPTLEPTKQPTPSRRRRMLRGSDDAHDDDEEEEEYEEEEKKIIEEKGENEETAEEEGVVDTNPDRHGRELLGSSSVDLVVSFTVSFFTPHDFGAGRDVGTIAAEMQASVKALFALDPDATAHNSTPFDQVR
jgi:hypothetical protein